MKKNDMIRILIIIISLLACVFVLFAIIVPDKSQSASGSKIATKENSSTGTTGNTEDSSLNDAASGENDTTEENSESTGDEVKFTEEYVKSKLDELRELFPDGKYWNHVEGEKYDPYTVTDTPCKHKENGEGTCNVYASISNTMYSYKVRGSQCLGFASFFSDYIFGTETYISKHEDYDKLKIGDQARINNETHSVVIIEKTDEYIVVAECNADYKTCKIQWGRKIYREDLKNAWYITRYEE